LISEEAAATQEPGDGGGRLHLGLVRWIDHRLERLEDRLSCDIQELRRQTAGLDARLAASETKADARMAGLDARLAASEAKADARMVGVDARLAASEAKQAASEHKMETRFAALDAKIETKTNLSIGLMLTILVAVLARLFYPHL